MRTTDRPSALARRRSTSSDAARLLAVGAIVGILSMVAAPAAGKAASTPIDVELPESFSVSRGIVLVGHLALDDATVAQPRLLSAAAAGFDAGVLTVCPMGANNGTLSAVTAALGVVDATCRGGEAFASPAIRFGPGTDLIANGTWAIVASPAAALASFAADGQGGLVLSTDGLAVGRPGDAFRFAATRRDAQVVVEAGGETRTYNGTQYAFLHDGATARWTAQAVAGTWHVPHVAVTPATSTALEEAVRPFVLLDIQEALVGPDGREPRSNVSGLLYEFGRVPAFVNGALLGRLVGDAGQPLDGSIALVRGRSFDLQLSERLVGTFEPQLTIASGSVAADGGRPTGPPWIVGLILWIGAALVLAVRRFRPARPWQTRLVWLGAVLLAALATDLVVVAGLLGTSAIEQFGQGQVGPAFASAVFEAVAVLAAWALVALPIRIAVTRLVPARWLMLGEAGTAAAWLVAVCLLPAHVLALGYAWARF